MMNNLSKIVTLMACASLSAEVFAFADEEAHRLYAEHYIHTLPSVQECGEYLFVIVEGDVPKDRHGDATREIMEAQLAALDNYVGSGTFGYVSPFSARLTERLRPKGGFEISSCPVVTVEENVGEKRFREASAFAAGPIKAERERLLQKKPSRRSVGAWAEDLSALLDKCSSDEMRGRMMSEAGLFLPLLFGPEHSMRCVDVAVDGAAVEKLFYEWSGKAKTQGDCESALCVLPTFSAAHRRLAEMAREQGNLVPAADEWIKAGVAGEVDEVALKSVLGDLAKASGSDVWREFAELRQSCLCVDLLSVGGSSDSGNCVRRSFGRVKFADKADSDSEQLFLSAKKLFASGRNLTQIIRDLELSLARNPGSTAAWRLYGDALRTDKRWVAAILAYHEVLSVDVSDVDAIYGVARCYEAMGLRKLAGAAAWWGIVASTEGLLRDEFAGMLKRVYPDAFL